MCKYSLFVLIGKSEYGELHVSKEAVLGSACTVYCARRGPCVDEKREVELADIQNSGSFFAESRVRV